MIESGLATDVAASRIHASQLISASVDRARAAVATYNNASGERHRNTKQIAGCIPPLTDCYFSNLVPSSVDHLISDYTCILSTLLDCNADILLAETLSSIREAHAILRSLHNINNQNMEKRNIPPIWMSFTIHDDQPTMLRSNELLETACISIIEESTNLKLPLDAIGINCSTPTAISKAVTMLTTFTEGRNIKVCAYGNCFKTTTSEWMNSLGKDNTASTSTAEQQINIANSCSLDYDEEGYMLPEVYAKFACEWAQAGADIIGGCCGSRPMHMKKVVSALKEYQ